MKKICIIVDHPSRDLDGYLILKYELEEKGFIVELISYYFKHEVLLKKPNVIIFPHYREQFYNLIKIYKNSGIMVVILDTEGGFFPDKPGLDNFIKSVKKSLKSVDLYFLWGKIHLRHLESIADTTDNVYLTGNPRFDLLSIKYQDLCEKELNTKKTILFNTNFSEINPKFQSLDKEIENSIKYDKVTREFIEKYNQMRQDQLKNFIVVIEKVASKYKDCCIKIRPHPFESFRPYKKIKNKNIEIKNEKPIVNDLLNADVIIQYGCHSAFESFMCKNYCLNLSFLNNSHFNNDYHSQVSINCNSIESMFLNIDKKINDKEFSGDIDLDQSKKILEDFFFKSDGKASWRISQIIDNEYKKFKNLNKLKISYINIFWPFTLRSVIATILKLFFTKKQYSKLQYLFGKKYFIEKLFFKSYIEEKSDQILKINKK